MSNTSIACAPSQVLPFDLAARFPLFRPLRNTVCLAPGVLGAPVGCAAVSFVRLVGAETLLAWNSAVAEAALADFHKVCCAWRGTPHLELPLF